MAFTTLIGARDLSTLLSTDAASTLVVDCRFDLADPAAGRRAYLAGHLPGAIFLDLDTMLSGPKTGSNGRHPLPDRDGFGAAMAELGVSAGTTVVAYDDAGGLFAARLWAMMRWLGHAATAVLEGGVAAWTAAGLALETEAPPPRLPGDLLPGASLLPLADYRAVRAASQTGAATILDARAPDRFRGENETLDRVGGHIPGARNRPFRDNLGADGRFKPPASLRAEFEAALAGRPAHAAIMSCGSGVSACHNLLALAVAGLDGAALYPGSWSEWSAQPDAPIATGPE